MDKKNIFLIAFIVIILDQLTKLLILSKLTVSQSIPLIKNFFHITFITNTGAGFGILKNQNSLFIFIAIVVLGIIFYYYDKIPGTKPMIVAFGFLLGGIIGNLVDRIFHGHVIDFIDFRIWPAFNIADSAITLSALYFIFYLMKKK